MYGHGHLTSDVLENPTNPYGGRGVEKPYVGFLVFYRLLQAAEKYDRYHETSRNHELRASQNTQGEG